MWEYARKIVKRLLVMFMQFLAVAVGGALGSVLRHGINSMSLSFFPLSFPVGILAVNVLGSFLMGFAVALFAQSFQPSPELKLFLITGLLGGFTTFSAFSFDAVALFERGEVVQACLYVALSVILSIAALVLGLFLVRGFTA